MAEQRKDYGGSVVRFASETALILIIDYDHCPSGTLFRRQLCHITRRGRFVLIVVIKREFRLQAPAKNRNGHEEKSTLQREWNNRVAPFEYHLHLLQISPE